MVRRIRLRGHVLQLQGLRPSTSKRRPPSCPLCLSFYNDGKRIQTEFLCCGLEDSCLECLELRGLYPCRYLKEALRLKGGRGERRVWQKNWLEEKTECEIEMEQNESSQNVEKKPEVINLESENIQTTEVSSSTENMKIGGKDKADFHEDDDRDSGHGSVEDGVMLEAEDDDDEVMPIIINVSTLSRTETTTSPRNPVKVERRQRKRKSPDQEIADASMSIQTEEEQVQSNTRRRSDRLKRNRNL